MKFLGSCDNPPGGTWKFALHTGHASWWGGGGEWWWVLVGVNGGVVDWRVVSWRSGGLEGGGLERWWVGRVVGWKVVSWRGGGLEGGGLEGGGLEGVVGEFQISQKPSNTTILSHLALAAYILALAPTL